MILAAVSLALTLSAAQAQFRGSRRNYDDRAGVPTWEVVPGFDADAFTFARLQYDSGGRGWGRGGRGRAFVDYPNADLNLSYRLQQLTSMQVTPDPTVVDLTDPGLYETPFLFAIDPRDILLSDEEVIALRLYLLNGGFLMVDDFWGNRMLDHLIDELRRVLPGCQPVPLELDHEIFHCVFELKIKPQVPSEDSAHRQRGRPWETWEDEISWEQPQGAQYLAIMDDKGRIMVLICWNTDLSDGWEEEGVSEWFFNTYAEKLAYPMAINIVFYAMTH